MPLRNLLWRILFSLVCFSVRFRNAKSVLHIRARLRCSIVRWARVSLSAVLVLVYVMYVWYFGTVGKKRFEDTNGNLVFGVIGNVVLITTRAYTRMFNADFFYFCVRFVFGQLIVTGWTSAPAYFLPLSLSLEAGPLPISSIIHYAWNLPVLSNGRRNKISTGYTCES